MKKFLPFLGTILLCSTTITFINCNKNVAEPDPQTWNYSTFTDTRDGKTYKYIRIGNKDWMAENLAYETVNGSWEAGGSPQFGAKYGRLYTWDAAKEAVPSGWHLPSDSEWKELEIIAGMSQNDADNIEFRGTNEGSKLKSISGWSENGNGTDNFGFCALPGGYRSNSGTFFVVIWYGYWWTSTDINSSAWYRMTNYYSSSVNRNLSFKGDGYSVRCVRD